MRAVATIFALVAVLATAAAAQNATTSVATTTMAPNMTMMTTAAPNATMMTTAAPTAPATTLPPVPNSTTTPALITATLTINGTDFGVLLADPVKRAALAYAIQGDLAAFLALLREWVTILNMREGSLIVDFAVTQLNANQTLAGLTQRLATAQTEMQIPALTAVYQQTFPGRTLTVGGVTGIQTRAPETTTTTAPTTTTAAPATGSCDDCAALEECVTAQDGAVTCELDNAAVAGLVIGIFAFLCIVTGVISCFFCGGAKSAQEGPDGPVDDKDVELQQQTGANEPTNQV